MLGSKEPKECWHSRQEELYSRDAEVHLHCRLFLGNVTNIIETFVFRQESVCTDIIGSRNVLPVQVVLVLSGEVMHTSLTLLSTLNSQS